MVKLYIPLAVITETDGALNAVRIGYFDYDFPKIPMKVLEDDNGFNEDNSVVDVAIDADCIPYNALVSVPISPVLPDKLETRDIPIREFIHDLNREKRYWGYDIPEAQYITAGISDFEGTVSGNVLFDRCADMAVVSTSGNVMKKAVQAIGSKGSFRRKKRSKKFIDKFDESQPVYSVDWFGNVTESTPEALKGMVAYISENVKNGVPVTVGNMLADGEIPGCFDNCNVISSVKFDERYRETISLLKLIGWEMFNGYRSANTGAMLGIYPFSGYNDDETRILSFPEGNIMICTESYPPVDIGYIPSDNKCRALHIKGNKFETFRLITGRKPEMLRWSQTLEFYQHMNIGMTTVEPLLGKGINYADGEGYHFMALKLPDVMPNGFIIELASVKELHLPKKCAGIAVLVLDKYSEKSIDFSGYEAGQQAVVTGDAPELETVAISGSFSGAYAGAGLKKLRNVTVKGDSLHDIQLILRDLECDTVDIYLDTPFVGKADDPETVFGAVYPPPPLYHCDIALSAAKPVQVIIHNKYSIGLAVGIERGSAPISYSVIQTDER